MSINQFRERAAKLKEAPIPYSLTGKGKTYGRSWTLTKDGVVLCLVRIPSESKALTIDSLRAIAPNLARAVSGVGTYADHLACMRELEFLMRSKKQ